MMKTGNNIDVTNGARTAPLGPMKPLYHERRLDRFGCIVWGPMAVTFVEIKEGLFYMEWIENSLKS